MHHHASIVPLPVSGQRDSHPPRRARLGHRAWRGETAHAARWTEAS